MSPLTTSMVCTRRQLGCAVVDRIESRHVGHAVRAIRRRASNQTPSDRTRLIFVRVDVKRRRGARLGADEALDGRRAVLAGQPRVSTSRRRTV